MTDRRYSRRDVAIVLAVAVAALAYWIAAPSVWLDEAFTLHAARLPVAQLFGLLRHVDAVFVLYYLLMHAWIHLAGTSAIALRLPSVLASIATIGVVYAIGVELLERRAAVFGAVLLATSFEFVDVGPEARPYSLALLACACAAYALLRMRAPSVGWAAAYVASSTLACYLHPLSVLWIVALVISSSLFGRACCGRVVAATVAVALLDIGVIALVHLNGTWQIDWIPAWGAWRILNSAVMYHFGGLNDATLRPPVLAYGMAALAIIGLVRAVRCGFGRSALVLVLWSAVPIVAIIAICALYKPVWIPYYFRYVTIAMFLLCGAAIVRLPRWTNALAGAVVLVAGVAAFHEMSVHEAHWERWRDVTAYLVAHVAPGDAVLVLPSYSILPFDYALAERGATLPVLYPSRPVVDALNDEPLAPAVAALRARNVRRMWLVERFGGDLSAKERTALTAGYTASPKLNFGVLAIEPFARQRSRAR